MTIDRLLTVCKVHVADHDLPTLLEGFLEIYFGHSESKQSDFQWLLQLANESTELHPEIELFRENLPNSVIKYFLRVQMSISGSEQLVIDAFNVLQLYDSEVMVIRSLVPLQVYGILVLISEKRSPWANYLTQFFR